MKGTPTKNPPSSTTPTPAPTQLNTSANSKDDETTIDDLLDCLLQGNNQAIDEYFKRTNKPLEQQEVLDILFCFSTFETYISDFIFRLFVNNWLNYLRQECKALVPLRSSRKPMTKNHFQRKFHMKC